MIFDWLFCGVLAVLAGLSVRQAIGNIRQGVVRFRRSSIPMEFTRERDGPLFWGFVALNVFVPFLAILGISALLYVDRMFP
jgi:hypothetical protein